MGADLKGWRRRSGAIFRNLRGAAARPPRVAALREAAEAVWLQEVQALTSTGSLAWNFATGEMRWSPETYRICGVASDAPLSRELILTLVHPDDMQAYLAAVAAAIASRARFDHELRIVRPDGDVRTLHMVGRFLDEQPEQFVGALTDVTDRKKDEEARRTSEFHYRNMFTAMAASFWELDFSGVSPILRDLKNRGVKDFAAHFRENPDVVRAMTRATRVIDVNDQTVAMFGRGDKAELLRDVEPFWTDVSLQVYADSVMASIRRQPGLSAETRLRRLDGTEFDALFTVSFPAEGMASSKFLIGVIDISERVNAQEALRKLQSEMAHAARLSTLGELAASIAHEVNQPLAAIATNASAGLRWLDRPEPNLDEVRTLSTRIASDARRAADIIARIRGMATQRTAESVPLSLKAVIEESLAFVRHEMQAQGVAMAVDLAPDLPQIMGDKIQLQQVVVNLVINAAQAMAKSPVGERRLAISARWEADKVVVDVLDRGPGIAADHFDRLFQSFFTTKDNGMGIGLPICRSIVEAHGGQIEAGNRTDGGARFSFSLPVPQAA